MTLIVLVLLVPFFFCTHPWSLTFYSNYVYNFERLHFLCLFISICWAMWIHTAHSFKFCTEPLHLNEFIWITRPLFSSEVFFKQLKKIHVGYTVVILWLNLNLDYTQVYYFICSLFVRESSKMYLRFLRLWPKTKNANRNEIIYSVSHNKIRYIK